MSSARVARFPGVFEAAQGLVELPAIKEQVAERQLRLRARVIQADGVAESGHGGTAITQSHERRAQRMPGVGVLGAGAQQPRETQHRFMGSRRPALENRHRGGPLAIH